jgi:hypothetical protein
LLTNLGLLGFLNAETLLYIRVAETWGLSLKVRRRKVETSEVSDVVHDEVKVFNSDASSGYDRNREPGSVDTINFSQ